MHLFETCHRVVLVGEAALATKVGFAHIACRTMADFVWEYRSGMLARWEARSARGIAEVLENPKKAVGACPS